MDDTKLRSVDQTHQKPWGAKAVTILWCFSDLFVLAQFPADKLSTTTIHGKLSSNLSYLSSKSSISF